MEVRLGGVRLASLGHVQDIKWSSAWGPGPSGPFDASCTVALSPTTDATLLRQGQTFEVWADGVRQFGGVSSEPQRGFPWTLNARGWARRAGDFEAVDSSGNPTTNPRVAVTEAIANGLEWSNPTAFPNTSIGEDDAASTQRLDQLLDNWAITAGMRWGTDAYGVAFAEPDPTEPDLWLDARDLPIGVASDGLYTRVRARYVSSVDVDGNPNGWLSAEADSAVAQADYRVIEYGMDLTGLGYLTGGGTEAASHAAAQLALMTVPQWQSGITTDAAHLRTAGDHGVNLRSVRAGMVVHLRNVPKSLGGTQWRLGRNVVLGRVEFDSSEPSQINLDPVNLAVRNLADVARQQAELAKRLGTPGQFRVSA